LGALTFSLFNALEH